MSSKSIEVDGETYRLLEFAAQMSGATPGEVVRQLVATASPSPTRQSSAHPAAHGTAIYADYDGHRTQGRYDPTTTRIDITSGPLTGRSYKTPSGAARAVVAHSKPGLNANRNGWLFWILDDGTGMSLQTIRRAA